MAALLRCPGHEAAWYENVTAVRVATSDTEGVVSVLVETAFWSSPNFWQPPRRSWPYEPTRLEVLAIRAGLGDEELRALLEREIERRGGEFPKHEPSIV